MVDVLYTGEFEAWWNGLTAEEQETVAHDVNILRERGIDLSFPRCSGITSSKHRHMRTANPAPRTAVPRAVCVRPESRGHSIDRRRQDRQRPLV